ncbi:uncharacterized protein BDZ83DRAFT_648706 [Colletotrichum acutatum]|uniref:Uncharacterized protein n=1 Tax=Glomerella acutata TaxID=27357 RepID=A0AAD8XJZ4_GLOAC|nr:uncharacterized protein BDZ83DRAFT_648706 [Colletotrichum acutatum]KAK1728445.1 hypothetical protein BDZ83DRAFT_648706 [Colletotrichum acutatum]
MPTTAVARAFLGPSLLGLGTGTHLTGSHWAGLDDAKDQGAAGVVPSSVAVGYPYRPNPVSPDADVLSTSNGPLGRFLFPWTVAVSALSATANPPLWLCLP